MIRDARRVREGARIDADVCIVGAGAAGITLARALRGSGLRVVVLESGGIEPDLRTQDLYRGENVGHEYFPLHITRLRFFGGTTNHWEGWCRPFDPIDFEAREDVPESGWPIPYDEMTRWWRKAHEICQLGPYTYEPEAWSDVGKPLPLDPERVTTTMFQYSPPTRFGPAYREDLEKAEDVTVQTNANVVDIEPSSRPTVRVTTFRRNTFTVRSSALVLCCGGLENPRLLLTARGGRGIGGDAVGRWFMEHPHMQAAAGLVPDNLPMVKLYELTPVPTGRVRGALVIPDEVVRAEKLLRFSLTLDAPEDVTDFERMQTLVRGVDRRATKPMTLYARTEQTPNHASRVRLGRKRDELGMPRIALDWRPRERDVRSIQESLGIVAEAFGAAGLGRFRLRSDREVLRDMIGGNHHMGTTRMGEDPETSVVDADLRMHDHESIYVTGSSTFPTSGFANPTLSVVALSLRLAEHLRKEGRPA